MMEELAGCCLVSTKWQLDESRKDAGIVETLSSELHNCVNNGRFDTKYLNFLLMIDGSEFDPDQKALGRFGLNGCIL